MHHDGLRTVYGVSELAGSRQEVTIEMPSVVWDSLATTRWYLMELVRYEDHPTDFLHTTFIALLLAAFWLKNQTGFTQYPYSSFIFQISGKLLS